MVFKTIGNKSNPKSGRICQNAQKIIETDRLPELVF